MGYACPVCEEPLPDGEHLADHLAFAAVTGDEQHESWLDEHAPGWGEGGTDELAPRVVAHAADVEFEVDTEPVRGHTHPSRDGETAGAGDDALDAEAKRILDEAAEMTERMQRGDDGGESPDGRAGTRETREPRDDQRESRSERAGTRETREPRDDEGETE